MSISLHVFSIDYYSGLVLFALLCYFGQIVSIGLHFHIYLQFADFLLQHGPVVLGSQRMYFCVLRPIYQ